ncbi:hypothetical protein BDV95DRAFT_611912 [Massariosphaeria phaeospora]|uniref:FAD-binding domain-containing protein n=1 Tax=Massariosphaeria phaeospora TaxID=100035 RepID=A0A7C8I3I0_9PLEO|nr:hypothetical protein BDV95DRAFT_611912 [Massariosphaeria phaeospora]
MTSLKPILIAGGGLSSLLLARSLLRANIPFRVFERDASIVFRAQGYRLRLSPEGLDAIEAVLGPADFERFYARCGKTGGAGFVAIDPLTGDTLGAEHPSVAPELLTSRDNKVVGISRGDMRALFLEGCEAQLRWSHHVTGYTLTATGVRAVFADGSASEEGALLVGGEGVRSAVARQLAAGAVKVYDLGARGIHGQAPSTAFAALGEGVFRMADETTHGAGKRVFLITNVRGADMHDPTVDFGYTLVGSPGVIHPPSDDFTIVGAPAAQLAKQLTAAWHPRVKPLFDNIRESEAAFWKLTCSSPDGVAQWANEPRVTILGDAVHAMTPAGGNGANTAVRDAALLGRLLAEAGGWGEGVTKAYEDEMRVYAGVEVKKSYEQARIAFGIVIDADTPFLGLNDQGGFGH